MWEIVLDSGELTWHDTDLRRTSQNTHTAVHYLQANKRISLYVLGSKHMILQLSGCFPTRLSILQELPQVLLSFVLKCITTLASFIWSIVKGALWSFLVLFVFTFTKTHLDHWGLTNVWGALPSWFSKSFFSLLLLLADFCVSWCITATCRSVIYCSEKPSSFTRRN